MWKILDVVKCQTWRHFRCGEILDVCKFVWFHELLALACQANRWYKSHRFAVRYLLMKFTVICRIFCFIVIYAVLSQNFFCRNLHTFCVEKNYTQNFVRGEKMTNIMYAQSLWIRSKLLIVWTRKASLRRRWTEGSSSSSLWTTSRSLRASSWTGIFHRWSI